ncbi:MAG: hypothetical protein AB7U82_28685 [Blastocatellales bacterium]
MAGGVAGTSTHTDHQNHSSYVSKNKNLNLTPMPRINYHFYKIRQFFRELWLFIKTVYRLVKSFVVALLTIFRFLARHWYWSLHFLALGLAIYIAAISWFTSVLVKNTVITKAPLNIVRTARAAEINLPETVQEKIKASFGPQADTFLKIAMAESGQNAGAKGWNCYYKRSDNSLIPPSQIAGISKAQRYSAACKKEHRESAWSVDCGTLQINVLGKVCPPESYDIDWNIKAAQGKYERQGWDAWSVCKYNKIKC